ncbi:AAA family ATPase [Streptomyces sp. NPDC097981]|uniref:ATP-binding protein n=1 Tax=Streptomyces sp. NPDC097981 TaxID=3155428 RepID=UPI003327FF0A
MLSDLAQPWNVAVHSTSDLAGSVAKAATADDKAKREKNQAALRRKPELRPLPLKLLGLSLQLTPWEVLHSLGRANVLARQGVGRGLAEHWASLKYCQALTCNDGHYMALSTEGRNPRRHYAATQSGELGIGFALALARRVLAAQYPDHSVSVIDAEMAMRAGWELTGREAGRSSAPRRPGFFLEVWKPGEPSRSPARALDLLHRATPAPAAAPVRTETAPAPQPVTHPAAAARPGTPVAPTVLAADRLLGRNGELALLAAAADRAHTGRAQVVLVSGEAGIGKSSLLDAALRQLPGQGWLVGSGQCPESEGAPPGRAWFDMLPDLARTAPPGTYADELAPLLAPGTTDAPGRTDGSPAQRFRLHRALLGWLRNTALRQPLAIVLDDLHRGDRESIELFLLCAEQLRDVPLLLVGSYRTGEGDLTEALARLAACSPVRLALGGLSDAQAKALLRRVAAGMTDRAATVLAERAGGNPFYLRESSLLLAGEGEQQALARIPQGVQDVLRRRLALLAPTVTAGLRLAAVAGREAPVALLVHAADSDADQLLDALEAGVTAGLLTEPRPGTVRFSHALVRDALEADLTRLRLARMHSRLGRSLIALGSDDVAATAHHLLRAAAVVSADAAPAVHHARLACEQAVRRYAPQNAEDLLNAALGLLADHPAAFADQDAALLRVTLLGQLVDCRIRMGAVVPAREAQEQAVAVAREEGRADLLTAAYTTWTEPTPWRVRPYAASDPEAVAELEVLLEDRELTDRQRCLLLDQLADALDDTDPRAVAEARRAVELARAAGEPRLRGLTLTSLLRKVDGELEPAAYGELHRELTEVAEAQDGPEYAWMSAYVAAGSPPPATTLRRWSGVSHDRTRSPARTGSRARSPWPGCAVPCSPWPRAVSRRRSTPWGRRSRSCGPAERWTSAGSPPWVSDACGCSRAGSPRCCPCSSRCGSSTSPTTKPSPHSRCRPRDAPRRPGRSSACACRSGATSPTPSWPGCAAPPPSPSATGRRPTRSTGTCCRCTHWRAARAASASSSAPSRRPWETSPGSSGAPKTPGGTTSKPRRWRPPGSPPSGRRPPTAPSTGWGLSSNSRRSSEGGPAEQTGV